MVTGDITQIDLPNPKASGLVQALKIVKDIEGIGFVYFDDKDVVRHKLVQQIVKAYDAFKRRRRVTAPTPARASSAWRSWVPARVPTGCRDGCAGSRRRGRGASLTVALVADGRVQ